MNVEFSLTVITGIIMAIAQGIEMLGLKAKYIPVANLLLGVILCSTYSSYLSGDTAVSVFEGIVVGLTASGFYSSTKNLKQGLEGA